MTLPWAITLAALTALPCHSTGITTKNTRYHLTAVRPICPCESIWLRNREMRCMWEILSECVPVPPPKLKTKRLGLGTKESVNCFLSQITKFPFKGAPPSFFLPVKSWIGNVSISIEMMLRFCIFLFLIQETRKHQVLSPWVRVRWRRQPLQ